MRAQATACACSLPAEHGVPRSRWSLACLVQAWLHPWLGEPASPSRSTLQRWLSAEKIQPWRFRSWQHLLDPQTFLRWARPVLRLYEQAAALSARGTWGVCADEKTSIQARAPQQPTRAAVPGHPMQIAPRYHRRGALHLFAYLSVPDGLVAGRCYARKRFRNFQHFLLRELVPDATRRGVKIVALILDRGSTHAPKQLQAWLNQQARLQAWPFVIKVYWLPTNASWLDQIEIWFSKLQRQLLTPNDFASRSLLARRILAFIQDGNRQPRPLDWSYTVAQLKEKIEKKLGTNS